MSADADDMTDEDFLSAMEELTINNEADVGELLKAMNENQMISWEEAERILADTSTEPIKCSLVEQSRPTEPDNDTNVDRCIQQLLENDPSLKQINLNNMKRTPIPQLRRLIEALAYNEHLEKISLANMGLYDNDVAVLVDAVKLNQSLKHLNLETNYLSGDFFCNLFDAALENQTLEEIKAVNQGISFSTEAEKGIIRAIQQNHGLCKVSLTLRLPEGRHKIEQATLRNGEIRRVIRRQQRLEEEARKKAEEEASAASKKEESKARAPVSRITPVGAPPRAPMILSAPADAPRVARLPAVGRPGYEQAKPEKELTTELVDAQKPSAVLKKTQNLAKEPVKEEQKVIEKPKSQQLEAKKGEIKMAVPKKKSTTIQAQETNAKEKKLEKETAIPQKKVTDVLENGAQKERHPPELKLQEMEQDLRVQTKVIPRTHLENDSPEDEKTEADGMQKPVSSPLQSRKIIPPKKIESPFLNNSRPKKVESPFLKKSVEPARSPNRFSSELLGKSSAYQPGRSLTNLQKDKGVSPTKVTPAQEEPSLQSTGLKEPLMEKESQHDGAEEQPSSSTDSHSVQGTDAKHDPDFILKSGSVSEPHESGSITTVNDEKQPPVLAIPEKANQPDRKPRPLVRNKLLERQEFLQTRASKTPPTSSLLRGAPVVPRLVGGLTKKFESAESKPSSGEAIVGSRSPSKTLPRTENETKNTVMASKASKETISFKQRLEPEKEKTAKTTKRPSVSPQPKKAATKTAKKAEFEDRSRLAPKSNVESDAAHSKKQTESKPSRIPATSRSPRREETSKIRNREGSEDNNGNSEKENVKTAKNLGVSTTRALKTPSPVRSGSSGTTRAGRTAIGSSLGPATTSSRPSWSRFSGSRY